MTQEQIDKYEFCKKHLVDLNDDVKKSPFKTQKYGCGSGRPEIEFTLERINQDMYSEIFEAVQKAKDKVNKIIEKL